MSERPSRIVDAHVHLWDPARTDWYPYLSGRQQLNMGDVTGMARRFDVPTYFAESAGWNVEKLVNVAAATGPHSIDETLELDERGAADGHPDAIIGGIVPTDVGGGGGRADRPADGRRSLSWGSSHGQLRRAAPGGRGAPRPPGAGPRVRADGAPRSAASGGRRSGELRGPGRRRRARGLAPVELGR